MALPYPDPKTALPLTETQLAAWKASPNLGAKFLESVCQYRCGEGKVG